MVPNVRPLSDTSNSSGLIYNVGCAVNGLRVNLWERKLFESELLVTEDVGAKSSIFDVDGEELPHSDIRSTDAEQYLITNESNDSLKCSGIRILCWSLCQWI